MKPIKIIIITALIIVISIVSMLLLIKSLTEQTANYDIETRKEQALEAYKYEQIPEADRKLLESETIDLTPKIEDGNLAFSNEVFENYKSQVYDLILSFKIFEADDLIQSMIHDFNTSGYEEEIFQFRRDLNLLMMLNEDTSDTDNFIDQVELVGQVEDPVLFLIAYLTLDEMDMKLLTVHPNSLMFNINDVDIRSISIVQPEYVPDWHQFGSIVHSIVKITVDSTLDETIEIYVEKTVDSSVNSTILYGAFSTVENTNHSILQKYIEKYK